MNDLTSSKKSFLAKKAKDVIKLMARGDIFCLGASEIEDKPSTFDYFDEEFVRAVLAAEVDVSGRNADNGYWSMLHKTGLDTDTAFNILHEGYNDTLSGCQAPASDSDGGTYLNSLMNLCRSHIEKHLNYREIEKNPAGKADIADAYQNDRYLFDVELMGHTFLVRIKQRTYQGQSINQRGAIDISISPKSYVAQADADAIIQKYLRDIIECYFYGWAVMKTKESNLA